MIKSYVRLAGILVLAGTLATIPAAGPSLGVITSNGDFLLDNAKVSGNATLTEGSRVKTTKLPSTLRLNDGSRVILAEGASAKVHRGRLVLEEGLSEFRSSGKFEVEAAAYRIVAEPTAAGRVFRSDDKTVQVASLNGTLRVFNARGIQLANVVAGGDILAFTLQAEGAAPPSTFFGCLLKKTDRYVIYDQTTRITVELRGNEEEFEQEWGNRVQVVGTTETTAQSEVAAQVMNVSTLTRIGAGGCGSVAAAIGGDLPAGARAASGAPTTAPSPAPSGGGGISAGTTIVIVAAIAGGGAAAALILSGKDSRSP